MANQPNEDVAYLQVSFDGLPDDLLLFIFRRLPLNDLIKCRLVSKRFRCLCDEVKVRELILQQNVDINVGPKSYWFPSNKLINYKDSINLKTFQSYRSVLKLDQNLRRLHLNFAYLNCYKMRIFNSLVQLEQLEIECDCVDNCTLTLPNLKIFKFVPQNQRQQLKLQAPKLEALDCDDLSVIEIDQPETIKHLKTELYHSRLEEFKNLEVLECGEIRNVNKEILSILSNLKVLSGHESAEPLEIGERRNLVDNMSFIMKQKLVLRRTELKVYLQGVQLTDGNHLDDFKLDLNDTKFQIENYANLYSSLHFITFVNYSHLIELMKQIPDDYFNKFFQIRSVGVATKVNGDHLIRFVSRLNFVENFVFKNASLDQSTLDKLTRSCDLGGLIVNEDQKLNLNFDCILECTQLTFFETNQPFPGSFDLAIEAFSSSDNLMKFTYKKDDETVEMEREFYRFSLICYRNSRETPTFSQQELEFYELPNYRNHLANNLEQNGQLN